MIEMALLNIIGIIMMKRTQQPTTQRMLTSLRRTSGLTSWASIEKGFHEREILPTGGAKYGLMLGSERSVPTLFFSA